jgi:hypothetical protein
MTPRPRRRPIGVRPLHLDVLESRLLMASDLPAGTFADLPGTASAGGTALIPFLLSPADFASTAASGKVSLTFQATAADGSAARVTGVGVETPGGLRGLGASRVGPGLSASVPTSGLFLVTVKGLQAGETVDVNVKLTGDVDGNFTVDASDWAAVFSSLGSRPGSAGYSAAADVTGDGYTGPADLIAAAGNGGASVLARPIGETVGIPQSDDPNGDGVVTESSVAVVGQAAPNSLVALQGGGGGVNLLTTSDATGAYRFASVPLAVGTNSFTTVAAGALSPTPVESLVVTRAPADSQNLSSEARMAKFGLTNIQGLCYTPEPSDDSPQPPPAYFDSDFWNTAFAPMWSSGQNLPGFTTDGGGSVNGRGDLATMQSLGVNFLHLYDWNFGRDHSTFLAQAKADGITMNVPVSNFGLALPITGPLPPGIFQHQLETVERIFAEVYPNLASGDTTPNPALTMWTIGNEPERSGFTAQQVAMVAQEIVYLENTYNVPDSNRLPIAVPLSWQTFWGSYNNPTPSVAAVEALYAAFQSTSSFAAVGINNATETVTPLPADFFTTRFVWANNPVGNDNSFFLGLKPLVNYNPYYNPGNGATTQIDWANIPMFFTEDGPSLVQANGDPVQQAAILKQELADVQQAHTLSGQTHDFEGAAVFQSLDQVTHKQGSETGFGIQTVQTSGGNFVYQTIVDDPNLVPPGGAGTWRLDSIIPKPSFNVVKTAFGG